MSKGLLKHDSILIDKTKRKINKDFVHVGISDKDGYSWEADGNAGMVVILNGMDSEIDMIGDEQDIPKLLATALIKTEQLLGANTVKRTIELVSTMRADIKKNGN